MMFPKKRVSPCLSPILLCVLVVTVVMSGTACFSNAAQTEKCTTDDDCFPDETCRDKECRSDDELPGQDTGSAEDGMSKKDADGSGDVDVTTDEDDGGVDVGDEDVTADVDDGDMDVTVDGGMDAGDDGGMDTGGEGDTEPTACNYMGKDVGICGEAETTGPDGSCEEPDDYEPSETTCDDRLDNNCNGTIDDWKDHCRSARLLGAITKERVLDIEVTQKGNIVAVGYTTGSLMGMGNRGIKDVFVAKFDADDNGTLEWVKVVGSKSDDRATGVATHNNWAYVTGTTGGAFGTEKNSTTPNTNVGKKDIFLSAFGPNGNRHWTQMRGTTKNDGAMGIASHGQQLFIVGYTDGNLDRQGNEGGEDIAVLKYNTSATSRWTYVVGSTGNDRGMAVATDSNGGVFFAGHANDDVGNHSHSVNMRPDLVFGRLDNNSQNVTEVWTEMDGTPKVDKSSAIAISGGSLYIGGRTYGDLHGEQNRGGSDAFVMKYDYTASEANYRRTRLVGTDDRDALHGLTADGNGGVHITGTTRGVLGQSQIGLADAFHERVLASGVVRKTTQFGTIKIDQPLGGVVVRNGHVYIGGRTNGDLAGEMNSGVADGFIYKLK